MNFVLSSSVNPAYKFDNLSEKQVHVGSGGVQKTAAATASGRGARKGSDAASVFSLPAKGAYAVRSSVDRYVRWMPGQSVTPSGNLC